jgi:hypothetical protein
MPVEEGLINRSGPVGIVKEQARAAFDSGDSTG